MFKILYLPVSEYIKFPHTMSLEARSGNFNTREAAEKLITKKLYLYFCLQSQTCVDGASSKEAIFCKDTSIEEFEIVDQNPPKFYIFGGDLHYPSGGLNDLKKTCNSLEESLESVANLSLDWWQITDEKLELLKSGNRK